MNSEETIQSIKTILIEPYVPQDVTNTLGRMLPLIILIGTFASLIISSFVTWQTQVINASSAKEVADAQNRIQIYEKFEEAVAAAVAKGIPPPISAGNSQVPTSPPVTSGTVQVSAAKDPTSGDRATVLEATGVQLQRQTGIAYSGFWLNCGVVICILGAIVFLMIKVLLANTKSLKEDEAAHRAAFSVYDLIVKGNIFTGESIAVAVESYPQFLEVLKEEKIARIFYLFKKIEDESLDRQDLPESVSS